MQKTIEVFKIKDLEDGAKDKAYYRWLEGFDYAWAHDNKATLKAFEELFPVKVTDWSYGGRGEGVSFDMRCDDNIEEMTGLRLAKYIRNNYGSALFPAKTYSVLIPHATDKEHPAGLELKRHRSNITPDTSCPLTGYYMDDVILDPVYSFLKKPDNRTFRDLMKECFESWVKACSEDMEYSSSMEAFEEDADANEWTFDAMGRII